MSYVVKNASRVSNMKPRHLFTTQEVTNAVQSAIKGGYVSALVKRHSSTSAEGCIASLDTMVGYQPYDDVALSFSTLKTSDFMKALPPVVDIPVVTPLPPTPQPPPNPIPAPIPPPKIPEANVLPLVPDEETVDGSGSDEAEGEHAPVNTQVYIKRCKRVRCERERYKKGMCKNHYYAYRKKNPWTC